MSASALLQGVQSIMNSRQSLAKAQWFLGLLLVLAVACAYGAGIPLERERAADVGAEGGPLLIPWLPGQSYPEGARPDARLDKPVQFWRAGMSLKQVFADIGEQTGVTLAFWPPGDENERVRVNLYLNPDHPPALRDLMAQLSWVTGCAFACEESAGEDKPYRYRLLSTSVADTAQSRIEEEREAAISQLRDEWQSRAPTREKVAGRLAEYSRALQLTTDELVRRYYGVDDHLLADMLDPTRRAAASFAVGLGAEAVEGLLDGEPMTLEWQDLTVQQQEELRSCLRAPSGRGRGGPPGAADVAGEGSWADREVTHVRVGVLVYGLVVAADVAPSESESRGRRVRYLMAPMLNLTGEGDLTPEEAVALRRGLGETVTDDEARALRGQWTSAQRDQRRQQWEARTQQAAEEAIAGEPVLSAETEKALTSFTLPIKEGAAYALWQIQEAVASATGMHVVSDCFAQPRRDLATALRFLYQGEVSEPTGLEALSASCLTTEDARGLVWTLPGDYRAGWEWQDAGPFLRFRSKGRDIWRAAMLTPQVSERLDQWLDPYVETAAQTKGSATEVDITLDPQQISLLAASLSDLQVQHGGKLVGGDPTEKDAAYRQTLREEVLGAIGWAAGTLRALATLGDSQWEQLRGAGLRVGRDLTSKQRDALGLSGVPAEGQAAGPPARPGRGGPPGQGRPGPMLGRGGPGQPPGGGPQAAGEQEIARMVMTLTEEPPWGGGRARGGAPEGSPGVPARQSAGGQGEQQVQGPGSGRGQRGRPGRGGGRGSVRDSYYLVFSVDGEVRGVSPIPRALRVPVSLPTALPQRVHLGKSVEAGTAGEPR